MTDRAYDAAQHRQEKYLAAFRKELHHLLATGESEQVAERLAHSHAGKELELEDAVQDAASEAARAAAIYAEQAVTQAVTEATKAFKSRVQGAGGRTVAAKYAKPKSWVVAQWHQHKHLFANKSDFSHFVTATADEREPSHFIRLRVANPGLVRLRDEFPNIKVSARIAAYSWLKDHD